VPALCFTIWKGLKEMIMGEHNRKGMLDQKSTHIRKLRLGRAAAGAFAIGAMAIGAFAIGTMAIGRLAISRSSIKRLEIDELVVGNLRVTKALQTPPSSI